MTPAQEIRASIFEAMHELTKDRPLAHRPRGPAARTFRSGPLIIEAKPHGDHTLLDAWMTGLGKVASFRAIPQEQTFETASLRRKTLPMWLPILDLEMRARAGQLLPTA